MQNKTCIFMLLTCDKISAACNIKPLISCLISHETLETTCNGGATHQAQVKVLLRWVGGFWEDRETLDGPGQSQDGQRNQRNYVLHPVSLSVHSCLKHWISKKKPCLTLQRGTGHRPMCTVAHACTHSCSQVKNKQVKRSKFCFSVFPDLLTTEKLDFRVLVSSTNQ